MATIQALFTKLQVWLPTLLSKKLGVFIASLVSIENTTGVSPLQKVWAIATAASVYIGAQAHVDAKAATPDVAVPPGDAGQSVLDYVDSPEAAPAAAAPTGQ